MAATERRLVGVVVIGVAAAAFMLPPAVAQTPHRVSASTHVYTDDDSLTVVHPSVAVRLALTEDAQLSAAYDADVITAATVDVRTSASVRPFEETRHGGSLALRHAIGRTAAVGGGVSFSASPDYHSYTASLSAQAETGDRIHAFALDLRTGYGEVGRVGDPEPVGSLFALGLSGGWTAVLSRRMVMDLRAAFEWNRGYLESPYRFVRIAGGPGQEIAVPEEVPEVRSRGALAAGLRLAVTDRVFLRGTYRFHMDDWGVVGHTVEARATLEVASTVEATLGARFLVQRGASFYHGRYGTYPEVPTLRTRDRELASGFGGRLLGSLRWRFVETERAQLAVSLRGEVHQVRYIDTPLLRRRRALVTGLSLIGEF